MEEIEPKTKGALLAQQRAEGEAMVAGWQASGLSMRANAHREGLSERRLGLWRRRLCSAESTPGSES